MAPFVIPQDNDRPIFSTKSNGPVPESKAQDVGEYLLDMAQEVDITAHNLLEDARRESSKLHEFFDWNDNVAAEKWRLRQARRIINHMEIVVVDTDTEEEIRTRAFHSIYVPKRDTKAFEMATGEDGRQDDEDEPVRAYVSTVHILEKPDYHTQAIENALRELRGWQRRFNVYSELKPVFLAIEELTKKLD